LTNPYPAILEQGYQFPTLLILILKLVHAPVGAQETHIAKPENLAMMAKLLGTLILPIIAVLTIPTHINIAIIKLQESDSLPNHYSFSGK
jgi:hypothetical protein